MHKSQYAIGALVDAVGRLAVCSEFVTRHSVSNRYSLSVERYLGVGEKPEEAIAEQFTTQLGIRDVDFPKFKKLAAATIQQGQNAIATRDIHVFVYQPEEPVTLNIAYPKRNPIEFVSFKDICTLDDDALVNFSFCAEKMISFLKARSHTNLGDILG